MIEIVLGWPPSDLSPNARLHWAKLARAKKHYRQSCLSVTKEQLKKYPITHQRQAVQYRYINHGLSLPRWFCQNTHTKGDTLWHRE